MSRPKITVPYPNTYWVQPGQFLAGEHPGDLSEDILTARLSGLLEAGIRTFINLTEEQEMESYYNFLRDLAEERQFEVTCVRIPIRDRGVPAVDTLRTILDLIDQSVANDNAVYVHCFAGIGRTGTVVGCYLQRHGLTTRGNVIKKIAYLRRLMPIADQVSPHTPEQVQLVENWNEAA